jgi:phenylalanyl-tRNA synthetase beta chain
MEGCEVRLAPARPFEHPERAATIVWHGEDVGRLFELHPSLVPKGRAAILDLDLGSMEKLDQRERRYEPIRRFPTSTFDITVDAPLRQPAAFIERELVKAAGSDLIEIKFLGEYFGPPLKEGSKSVTYRLAVGAADHTLSSEEVDAIDKRVKTAILNWAQTQ